MNLDLQIRPADRGDTRFLAWVMQEAGRSHLEHGIMDVLLPDSRQRLDFVDATLRTPTQSFFHHQGFLVAEVDGRAAAALTGYEGEGSQERVPVAFREAWEELGWPAKELDAVFARFGSLARAFPDVPDERWVIEFVATAPEFRGHGIVSLLLEEILERGRERGYDKAQVGCYIGNTRALRAYERAGFAILDEKRDADWEAAIGCPGISRLHMDL